MKKALVATLVLLVVTAMAAGESPRVVREIPLTSSEGSLVFNLTTPQFELVSLDNGETRVEMSGVGYKQYAGYPRLPMPTYTFALPPGSEVVSVEVTGTRSVVPGNYLIEASLPEIPLNASGDMLNRFNELYLENRNRIYSGAENLAQPLGEIHGVGERREYSLVTVAVYPFAYDPVSGELSVAKDVTVRINYAPVDAEHASFIADFIEKGTIYPDVPEHVYNKDQARQWYRPGDRLLAKPRITILTTEALKSMTYLYAEWRRNTGFETTIVTKEEIASSTSGADLPQKIRNYLRANASSIDYLLIVGHYADIPMRVLQPFNNGDVGSYWDDPEIVPIPGDCPYYGDLSKPDDESWNKDGDSYYGEAMNASAFQDPQDAPDMEMEIHVGRINNSYETNVPGILEKTWLFEYDNDNTYKKTSVLNGGILWYPNQNGSGAAGYDGAHYMEYLMSNDIIESSLATTLYEKEGDGPSLYACDVNFTQTNLKNTLKNTDAGIFVENNHGWRNSYARCVWNDDGDGVPEESQDLDWPSGLESTDAFFLNTEKPNVAFLLSCLNGYPEINNSLAQSMLNYGSAAVVAHTRSALGRQGWTGPGDGGQNALYYYVLENYLKNAAVYDYVLGDAVDAGRLAYFNSEYSASKYINTYEHMIFGDPSLRHMGRTGNLPAAAAEGSPSLDRGSLSVDLENRVCFSLPKAGSVTLEVWDAAGRKVQTLLQGYAPQGAQTLSWDVSNLASGTYFITLKTDAQILHTKSTVIR